MKLGIRKKQTSPVAPLLAKLMPCGMCYSKPNLIFETLPNRKKTTVQLFRNYNQWCGCSKYSNSQRGSECFAACGYKIYKAAAHRILIAANLFDSCCISNHVLLMIMTWISLLRFVSEKAPNLIMLILKRIVFVPQSFAILIITVAFAHNMSIP